MRPAGSRRGNGALVYLCEIGSMTFRSPSGRRSTMRPRIWTSSYGFSKSTSESAIRASRFVFFAFSEPSPVATRMRSPSRPTHTGAICGEPSAMRVARCAKFGLSISFRTSSDNGMSAPLEHRRALLEEGLARFRRVLGRERAADVRQLVAELGLEVDRRCAHEAALGQAARDRRALRELRAVLGEARLERGVVDDLANEAEAQRLVGIDSAVLEEEAHRLLVT